MNKYDYITKIYNIRKGLNDPKFKSYTHKFYYAKGILKDHYPDDIDIIRSAVNFLYDSIYQIMACNDC